MPDKLAAGYVAQVEPGVLGYTLRASLVSGLVAGAGPGLTVLYGQRRLALHGERSEAGGVSKQRLRRSSAIAEVAGAFLLLAAMGLFLASLQKLQQGESRLYSACRR